MVYDVYCVADPDHPPIKVGEFSQKIALVRAEDDEGLEDEYAVRRRVYVCVCVMLCVRVCIGGGVGLDVHQLCR